MIFWNLMRSSLEREVESERNQLAAVLKLRDDADRTALLRKLATKVGASAIKMYPGHGYAASPELAHNIQIALQTKAMIAAVRTSSNHVIIAVLLTIVSCLSMVAAWIAVLSVPGGS